MTTGTSYFESFQAAVNYYQPYLGDPEFGKDGRIARKWKDETTRKAVQAKLDTGEIHIGKPPLKEGQRLTIHTTERRYFIVE